MPVFITGVEDALGRATAQRMLQTGGEVRVWLDAEISDDADARGWRARGCKAAIGTADDEGHLEAALEQVHTVVHLAGGPLDDPKVATDALATLSSAALGAGCRRLIWVTDLALTAAEELEHPPSYVAALTERAQLLAELPMDVVGIRTGIRYGPDDRLTGMLAASTGALREAVPHSPVWIDDVAGAVLAADSQRGAPAEVHIDVDLVGPETVALARICTELAQVRGLAATAPPPEDVAMWLRVPAVGPPDALGRQGVSFSDGLHLLAQGAHHGG